MLRRTVCFLTLLLLCLSLTLGVHAAAPLLVDNSDLLSAQEASALQSVLEKIRDTRQMDVVIVTANSLDGKSPRAYADDFYDNGGYADDGVLLLLCIPEGEWYVSTSGAGISVVTDADIDNLFDVFSPYYRRGDFSGAFTAFAEGCDRLLARGSAGRASRKALISISPVYVLGSLLIGVIAGFVTTGTMKKQLKSVSRQTTANPYMRPGSLHLTQSQDTFLYRTVSRVEKPKDTGSGPHGGSSTHRSSSGHTHGGHGRRL